MSDKPKSEKPKLKFPPGWVDKTADHPGRIFVMHPAHRDVPGDYGEVTIIDPPAKTQASVLEAPPPLKRETKSTTTMSGNEHSGSVGSTTTSLPGKKIRTPHRNGLI